MSVMEFYVEGDPATKGSWRAIRRRDGGTFMKPDNDREQSWAEHVAWAANQAMRAEQYHVSGPLRVELFFRMQRPRRSGYSYPPRGDIDKLVRSVLDALTGIAYADDKQVVQVLAEKAWTETQADPPGVLVRVSAVRQVGVMWEAA